jgi:hypothetical protein
MATFPSSPLALLVLLQAPAPGTPAAPPAPVAPADSLAVLRERAARDSTDPRGWLSLGRAYLDFGTEAARATGGVREDSASARARLDTAEAALERAAALAGPGGASGVGDSARVWRVAVWAARSRLAWEAHGSAAGPDQWGPLPQDLRIPAVLEELGENLLRACPTRGVLLTAGVADSYAAWYMRFARGLRPDLLVVPLNVWRSDRALRARLAVDLQLGRRAEGDAWLGALSKRRPVCVSMAFERPPEPRPRIAWQVRPLVWVAGPTSKSPRVPPRDFGFAALRLALDAHDPWSDAPLAVYARAVRSTPALCEPLATFRIAADVPACRRPSAR